MSNYYQKILLLCVLLLGCILTSVGVEYFSQSDEPIPIPPSAFVVEATNPKSSIQNKKQERTKFAKQLPRKIQLININTATEAELDTLPGIGPAIAKRIIAFRKEQPFTKPEDIMLVKGIGKKKFAQMREMITVE